mmetsp:Transcript_5734/g.8997  ORF Transcript_5734/g.8997 Transcript_5734/m.8997 type:complete len:250 (+) Transcript_5734:258-1007(+)
MIGREGGVGSTSNSRRMLLQPASQLNVLQTGDSSGRSRSLVRDDAHRDVVKEFVGRLRSYSDFFKLKVESIDKEVSKFLDVVVYKGDRWIRSRRLNYGVYRKPTSRRVPLDQSSAHHASCHLAWPRSEVARFRKPSDSKETFLACLKELQDEFRMKCPDHAAVVHINDPEAVPTRSSCRVPFSGSRMIIPYRMEWNRAGLPSKLFEISSRWTECLEADGIPRHFGSVSLAWRLGGLHLFRDMEQLTMKK